MTNQNQESKESPYQPPIFSIGKRKCGGIGGSITIEILRDGRFWYSLSRENGPYGPTPMSGMDIESDAQQIIDALNERSEWISVEDRLPEKERALQTFIVSLNGKVFPTQFTVIAWRDLGVTHWRELPEPPTNGKDER